jgi:hypothetical protein
MPPNTQYDRAIELAEDVERAIDALETAIEAYHAECTERCRVALTPKLGKPHPIFERSLDYLAAALRGRRLIGLALGGQTPPISVAEPFLRAARR